VENVIVKDMDKKAEFGICSHKIDVFCSYFEVFGKKLRNFLVFQAWILFIEHFQNIF